MNIILCAKSSSGKDFARNYLITKGYKSITSSTTRPIREGEIEGKDYYYISEQDFIDKRDSGYFIETRDYDTLLNNVKAVWRYGTPFNEFNSNNSVSIKDLVGAKQIKDKIDNVKVIYIHCDNDIRETRVRSRGSFCEVEWARRCQADNEDFDTERIIDVADYYINNNEDLESFKQQIDIVLEIIENESEEDRC